MNISNHNWRKLAYTFTMVLLLILGLSKPANAEVIRQFDVDVRLKSDCTLDVTETIHMDFEDSERHGIFRIIPVQYQRYGENYSVVFNLLNVTDEENSPLNYVQSYDGSDVNIKIGDSNRLLTGRHTYCIHYLVRRAINFFNDAPEVYWNATGNEWPYGIQQTNVRFYPPQGVNTADIKTACYIGETGSTTPGEISKNSNYIEFQASYLGAGEGLTMVAQVPAGCVTKPTFWQEAVWFLKDWWLLITIPALTCTYLLPLLFWRTHNPDGNQAIAVEWGPPKDLSPAEVGTLIDESCDMQDVVSTLVDLAVRGYLQIKEIESSGFLFFSSKDYEFKREHLNKSDDVLLPHEEKFLNALFAGDKTAKLSDLKDKFYIHLTDIRIAIYKSLMDKKLFVENPDNVRQRYIFAAGGLWISGLASIFYFGIIPNHISLGSGLIISGAITWILSYFMPARTRAGWKERAQCLGFKRFVQMAEKDRIAALAKDDPTIFGRLLPYAMVLGAADQWADAFHGLLSEPPSWYVPYGYGTPNYIFSSRTFVHSLGSGMNTMGHTFSSTPTSSAGGGGSGFSGGFSGGGFGGGGGGSW